METRESRARSKSFEDVELWQRAHKWVLDVYKLTELFPKHEIFGLTSQLRRAAVSIAANFAEGFTRDTTAEKARFYNMSRGSAEECRYYLILVRDLGYAQTQALYDELLEMSRMLRAYVEAMRRNTGSK